MAGKPLCFVADCGKTSDKAGFCNAHYLRMYRRGTTDRARADNGAPEKFLLDNISYGGDDCLFWPYARGQDGRGRLKSAFAPQAHRAMCVLAHGQPPSGIHEAAHSCGKGHEGCINPRHLRWATPLENTADRDFHGTELRGEDVWNAKLTEDDVRSIRRMKGNATQREIGNTFGVDGETIGNIHRGETWAWLK